MTICADNNLQAQASHTLLSLSVCKGDTRAVAQQQVGQQHVSEFVSSFKRFVCSPAWSCGGISTSSVACTSATRACSTTYKRQQPMGKIPLAFSEQSAKAAWCQLRARRKVAC